MSTGYRRQEGVEAFSVFIDDKRLPSDHPYRSRGHVEWSIMLRDFLTELNWTRIEIGEFKDSIMRDGERTETFEAFGLTNRGNACRIGYQVDSTVVQNSIEGTIFLSKF